MKISTIRGLQRYIKQHSHFSGRTINSVIFSLGFHPQNEKEGDFIELSAQLENCAEHGANCGFGGFIYYHETISFYKANRKDIVNHIEQTAAELGTDIISMVQNFGIFRNSKKPSAGEVGKALWGSANNPELTTLYNVFAWYALEEVSHTWYRYLEEHPTYRAKLSA